MSGIICRIRGHRLRFAEFDPITVTHALHCMRCGLHGWANEDVDRMATGAGRNEAGA